MTSDEKHFGPTFKHFPSIPHGKGNAKKTFLGENSKWYIQEKIDGSQCSFQWIKDENVTFYCRSSVRSFEEEDENSLFRKMMQMVRLKAKQKLLNPKLVYHAEVIQEFRHSTNTYERLPAHFLIVYDIQEVSSGKWLWPDEMKRECDRIGFEVVSLLYQNKDESVNPFQEASKLIAKIENNKLESCLGGIPEGIVIKHPAYEKSPGHVVAMKFKMVSGAFKERQRVKKQRSGRILPSEYLEWIGSMFDVPARFHKAKQHLEEQQKKLNPSRIELEKELDVDLLKENREEIEMYIRSHFSKWISLLKKEDGLSKLPSGFVQDSVMQQLKKMVELKCEMNEMIASFLPDVCRAARKSFLPLVCMPVIIETAAKTQAATKDYKNDVVLTKAIVPILEPSEMKKLLLSIGCAAGYADTLATNVQLSNRIVEVCREGGVDKNGCLAEIGNTLIRVATLLSPESEIAMAQRRRVVELIVNGKLAPHNFEKCVTYFKKVVTFDTNEFERACGIGIVITNDQIKTVVTKMMDEHKSIDWTTKYNVLRDANQTLEFASGTVVAKEVDTQFTAAFGPYSAIPKQSTLKHTLARAIRKVDTTPKPANIPIDNFKVSAGDPFTDSWVADQVEIDKKTDALGIYQPIFGPDIVNVYMIEELNGGKQCYRARLAHSKDKLESLLTCCEELVKMWKMVSTGGGSPSSSIQIVDRLICYPHFSNGVYAYCFQYKS